MAMDAIGVRRPDHAPRASEYIGQMVDLIAELEARGDAYETSDGVYMAVDRVPGYGVLAPGPIDALLAGARVDVIEEKRSPATSRSGRRPSRASRRGSHRGDRAGRVGTPSAWP